MRFLIITLVIAVALMYGYVHKKDSRNSTQESFIGNDNTVKIKNGDTVSKYILGERVTHNVVGTSYVNKSSSDAILMGIFKEIAFFNQNDILEFQKNFSNASECPADFFNGHSKRMFLATVDGKLKNEIENINWDLWKQTKGWRNFTISGSCVNKIVVTENGKSFDFSSPEFFSDCRMVLVDGFEATPYINN